MCNRNKKAIILDRDGTILVEKGFLSDPDGAEFLPGVAETIKLLNSRGISVVIVSNQSGVARGFFSEDEVRKVNSRMIEMLSEQGAKVDALYYCPHHKEGVVAEYAIDCDCRKPKPGMIHKAIDELGIVPIAVIGDQKCDVELGKSFGILSILVLTGYGENQPDEVKAMADYVAQDLADAVDWVLSHETENIGGQQ